MEKKKMPETSTELSGDALVEITRELREVLADVFALYLRRRISTGTRVAGIFATTIYCLMRKAVKSSR